ncbi:MAG: hypothetical protein GKS06_19860 [Acidobacteria bacterium]|nr:hypothetical protein [Acidobacteriota bacterium]
MVLLGILPPDGLPGLPKERDKVLKELSKLARQADPDRYPDVAGALRSILANLDDNPREVVVNTGGRQDVVLFGKYELQFLTNLLVLGRRSLMEQFPDWIVEMQGGDFTNAAAASQFLRHWQTSAMSMAVTCTTGSNPKRVRKAAKQARRSITGAQPAVADACEPWAIGPLDGHPLTLTKTNVPALIISGTLDGTTPDGNAKALRRKLPKSHLLKLIGATHSDLLASIVLDAIDDYLGGASVPGSIPFDWSFAQ